jgi:hypothetical protein
MKRYVLCILAFGLALGLAACGGRSTPTPKAVCTPVPIKEDAAQEGVADGAVVVYERIGGSDCIDEVWNIYPDGRIVGENGRTTLEEKLTPEEVSVLLAFIDEQGFFDLWNTEHTACRNCFTYNITVSSDDKVLTIKAVDGGTDTPGAYWQVWAEIKKLVSDFPEE